MTDLPKKTSSLPESRRNETYRRLLQYEGAESVHQLIARDGLEVLDHAVPYLLRRLQWLALDQHKRSRREIPSELSSESVTNVTPLYLDPAERIAHLDALTKVLARLSPEDAALLWWAAAGFSGAEQVTLWRAAGFDPSNPTEAYLRQRISRARRTLRDAADSGDSS